MMAGGKEENNNPSMIKIGPAGGRSGGPWDEKGRGEIVQIFIWHSDRLIYSIQFQYFEDDTLVLSDRFGGNGNKFDVVSFKYPSEYLTGVSGHTTTSDGLISITFTTNLGTYGPFGNASMKRDRVTSSEFCFQLGKNRQFGGFYGTASSYVSSIGLYLNPVRTLSLSKDEKAVLLNEEEV